MTPSHDANDDDPINPVDGLGLVEYVEICRALIRHGADSERRTDEVLADHGITPDRWAAAYAAWTQRIRRDPDVRSEFQRMYAGPPRAEHEARNE